MSKLTNSMDEVQPYDDWYKNELDYFVGDAATRGIIIDHERIGRRDAKAPVEFEPAISFSGFWSQGDGLAFDAKIDWPKFFEAHPDLQDKEPIWFLLLSANPDYMVYTVRRSGRNRNCMELCTEVEFFSDTVENGFFAGKDINAFDTLHDDELQAYVREVLKAEAHQMYKSLEATYNAECEYQREQRIEDILEEELEQLQRCLAQLLFLGESFTYQQACAVMDFDDNWIDQGDLSALGLIEYHSPSGIVKGMHITQKGKELLCLPINGKG